MAERACAALADGGARLSIANRTPENGARLARQYGGRALPLSALSELLPECDVVLAITASPGPLLDKAALPGSAVGPVAAGAGRPRRAVPLLLIDLAVPRNIAEEVRQLPGIRLIDIDDLRLRAAANLDERREEVPRVEAIIAEEVAAFERGDTAMLPLIGDLHRHAEQIRQRELARALRGLAGIDGDVREQVEHLSRALVTQLLHGPSARLRAAADRGLGEDYARVIRDLFALEESAGPHDE
jgi:glutamyl-tRNA reductase